MISFVMSMSKRAMSEVCGAYHMTEKSDNWTCNFRKLHVLINSVLESSVKQFCSLLPGSRCCYSWIL